MKINYKFNKSSEALTCEVESVELEIIENTRTKGLSREQVIFSQQELKDYINAIKEKIEFIGSSSIDDVLLKDWLGEWEYTDCGWTELMEGKESIKIGSPKLNCNWKFKIK